MTEKISVSINDDQLKWLDSEISNEQFASRSHGIRYALKKLMEKSK